MTDIARMIFIAVMSVLYIKDLNGFILLVIYLAMFYGCIHLSSKVDVDKISHRTPPICPFALIPFGLPLSLLCSSPV